MLEPMYSYGAAGGIQESLNALLGKSAAPLADRHGADADPGGNGLMGVPRLGASDHDPGSQCQSLDGGTAGLYPRRH